METKTINNPILYAVGLIAMVLSVSLFVFALYIVPYAIFGLVYDVPRFIILIVYWYQNIKGFSGISLVSTILLPFFLSSGILALIAKRLTTRIDNQEMVEIKSFKNDFMKLLKPALYEILLIFTVLFFLYLAEFIIVMRFE
jgi:hypothetical protein